MTESKRAMTFMDYLSQEVVYQAPHAGTPAVQIADMEWPERRAATQWMMSRAEEIKAAWIAEGVGLQVDVAMVLEMIGLDAKTFVGRTVLYRALGSL